MRIAFVLLFALASISICKAATDTTYYYDKYNYLCTPREAVKYRIVSLMPNANGLYHAAEYKIGDTIVWRGTSLGIDGRILKGIATYYYGNGKKESEGEYDLNYWDDRTFSKRGIWTHWRASGNKFKEKRYEADNANKKVNISLVSYWDTTNVQTIKEGNGFFVNSWCDEDPKYCYLLYGNVRNGWYEGEWTCKRDGSIYYVEQYNVDTLTSGVSYDKEGKKYTYTKAEEGAEYPGGDMALIKFLQKNIQYPAMERDNDIQGRVMIRFVVDTDGSVIDPYVARSVSPGLDKESLRVAKLMSGFIPGKRYGQIVKVSFTLPVVYRLQ